MRGLEQPEIPKSMLDFNLSLWRLGRDLAGRGVIGWHCIRAVKTNLRN
ncbi:MAG: hypothetical protein WD075_08270 [Rhodospirillales bacterium]